MTTPRPPIERLLERRVVTPSGCWEPKVIGSGRYCYTHVGIEGRKKVRGHILAFEHFVGPVPAGCELDHLCRNPPCFNPDHLDPVPHAVNIKRGYQALGVATHCPSGHALDEANTYVYPKGHGGRGCRECDREAGARYRARRKAEHGTGERAKLTMADADEIRERLALGETQVSIATTFDVSESTIRKIKKGLTWKTQGETE